MAFEDYNPRVGQEQALYAVPLRLIDDKLKVLTADVPKRFKNHLASYRSVLGIEERSKYPEYMSWRAFAKYIEYVSMGVDLNKYQ